MRIAISGAHNTGKTTLVEALAARLPGYVTVPEPYALLEDEGYTFALPPTAEDYVRQLQCSLAILADPVPNLIVDRCPLDFLAYLAASRHRPLDPGRLRDPIRAAMARLDLVVVTRIDPIYDPAVETDRLRQVVDSTLEELVADDELDLLEGVTVLPLGGPWERRVEAVLTYMQDMAASSGKA